jgi:WD40 repeat protein/DNA-binding SARP family transcriptional activator
MSALDEQPPPDVGSQPEVGEVNMDVHLLGPVEVVSDETSVALGGPKQRALLAMLALEAGSTVSVERLIDGLWGDDPPATAAKLVQLYVSHLRKAMARCADDGAIATRGGGYELRVGRHQVDAARFERLLAQGAAREALSLWRGPPLGDVAKEPFAAPEIRRLDELRTAALEVAIDQDLEAGRHREVLPELESLLAREPLRERLHGQRMLALYRCGRQADALEAYRQARATLVEQIGVEPGPDLRRLHDAILRQDPSLDTPAEETGRPGRSTPLLGRDAELERLRSLWWRAREAGGASVLVTGGRGTGKTRLARELAHEVRRERGAVVWCDGEGDPDVAFRAAADARRAERPTLLVMDDLDRAPGRIQDAFRQLAAGLPRAPLLVLTTATEPDGIAANEMLALGGLAPDAAAALARFHAGARDGGDLPVDRIVEETGGVPALVQEAAAEWTRAQAVRRLGDAAARTSAERVEWRLAEDDLATSVVEVQGLRERAAAARGDRRLPGCPFKGLASFDVEDAAVFFGRERLVADMVARLPGAPLMGVVGPSGSGKSSAMRAGLLAALAGGVLPGSESWPLVVIRPGHRPMQTLRRATADLPARGRWVLAIDQFEEVFTACRDEDERAAFVSAVVGCARDARRKALVIVAIRADFYGHCAGYPELSRMLGANHVLVGPMHRHELRRAIELPARHAGLVVEPELVDALIADVEGEPGGLPLLSTALLELWQHRDGRRLYLGAYEQTGGVRGAVARLAEVAYTRLDGEQREQAQRILLRLSGDEGVRARVPIAELGDAETVLAVLARERLITIGEGEVEVAHEALLREWPRLRGWLEEDAEGRRLHGQLTHAARDWDAAGRDPSELYRGARLAAALDWAATHTAELNATERNFLDDSRAASERAQRRLRALLAGVASLLVLAVIAGLVALEQRGSAREQAVAADAQRLGARALAEDDLDLGLLLARQGVALDDSVQTRGSLLAALLKSPAALGVLRGDGERMTTVVLSPDQRTLAAGNADNKVFLFDTRTRRLIRTLEPTPIQSWITEMAFTPDGSRLAIGHDVETYGNKVAILDVRTGRVLQRIDPPADRVLSGLRYSDDGRTLDLIAARWEVDEGSPELVRYDARTGRRLLGPVAVSDRGYPSVTLTGDGRRLVAVGAEETTVRDAKTLRVLESFPVGGLNGHALSSDDRTVAIARDASVRLLDLRTGAVRTAEGRHGPSISQVRFTPDGRTLATAGEDGKIALWDVQSAASTGETLSGHAGPIASAQITRDGGTLYTSSVDGTVFIWDLAGSRRLGRPFQTGTGDPRRPHLALSSDGRLIAAGQEDGAISIVDARTLERRDPFPVVTTGQVLGIGFLPGSHRLVVGGPEGFLAIVDADRGRALRRLRGHRGAIYTPGISADGRLLATGSDDNTVRLWALPDGRPLGAPLRFRRLVSDVQLSPDGRWLTVVVSDEYYDKGAAEVWDVRTRRRARTLARPDRDKPGFLRFSPDGKLLVMGYRRGLSQVWSTTTWKPVTRPLAADAGAIDQAAISPDGRTLATGSLEGTTRMWDIETEQAVGAALPGLPAIPVSPYFTTDGKHLIASYETGRAYHWDIRPESLARHACQVAGRRLTRAEWAQFLPDRPYEPAC